MEEKDIFDWLEEKEFEELDEQEKAFVLKYSSEAIYKEQRHFIKSAGDALNADINKFIPSPNIKSAVYQIMQERQTESIWKKLFSLKVPAYQPALALICFVIFLPFLWKNEVVIIKENDSGVAEILPLKQIDTVVVEKIIIREKPTYIIKEVAVKEEIDREQWVLPQAENVIPVTTAKAEEVFRQQIKKISRPASKNKQLKQFLVAN